MVLEFFHILSFLVVVPGRPENQQDGLPFADIIGQLHHGARIGGILHHFEIGKHIADGCTGTCFQGGQEILDHVIILHLLGEHTHQRQCNFRVTLFQRRQCPGPHNIVRILHECIPMIGHESFVFFFSLDILACVGEVQQ